MNKFYLKYLTSIVLFIDICCIAAIGFLLAFVIPKGRVAQGSKFFLGLHRHDWGDIHLSLSILLLLFLIIHLWFNWTWIVQATRRYFGERWKSTLWGFAGAWVLVLAIAWIATKI